MKTPVNAAVLVGKLPGTGTIPDLKKSSRTRQTQNPEGTPDI